MDRKSPLRGLVNSMTPLLRSLVISAVIISSSPEENVICLGLVAWTGLHPPSNSMWWCLMTSRTTGSVVTDLQLSIWSFTQPALKFRTKWDKKSVSTIAENSSAWPNLLTCLHGGSTKFTEFCCLWLCSFSWRRCLLLSGRAPKKAGGLRICYQNYAPDHMAWTSQIFSVEDVQSPEYGHAREPSAFVVPPFLLRTYPWDVLRGHLQTILWKVWYLPCTNECRVDLDRAL